MNQIPQGRRIVEKTFKKDGSLTRLFIPTSCMQCRNAPCLKVCPTSATQKSEDGIIYIDHQRCIGCHACILACPYDARAMIGSDALTNGSGNDCDPTPDTVRIGLSTKCDLCFKRIREGQRKGLIPGVHDDATPLCICHCLADALTIYDRDDPDNGFFEIIERKKAVCIRGDLGTEPSIYYING
jgi:phenylacetyl-CoA:acceptor oxidoreductase subunit 1